MGMLVLAAKVTHVPSLIVSERPGALLGKRAAAIEGLRELGRRARERNVDTFVVFDTHWISNFGLHLNAKARHQGVCTSPEAPQMIHDLAYDMPGDPDLAALIAEEAGAVGLAVHAHHMSSLPLEYGTVVPMRYIDPQGTAKVLPVAAPIFATLEENKAFGVAMRRAVDRSQRKVAMLASGSLSHRLVSNSQVGDDQWDVAPPEFNRQMDLRVLELWVQGRYAEFVGMLGDYSAKCNGEALMADTQMLFGALGWQDYAGETEVLSDYFPSSGSGQINVEFHLTGS